MKFMISIAIVLQTMALLPFTSWAQSANRRIPMSYAQGHDMAPLQELKVWAGYGLSLSFIPTGEVIQKVWLDDPSQVSLDFDRGNCVGRSTAQSVCSAGDAMVLHLRRIAPIQFPQLLTSNGSTTLKVITQTPQQERRLYQFRLLLSSGVPEYVTVEIVPDRVTESITEQAHKTQTLVAVQAGLQVAERRGQIKRQQPLWQRLQLFITLVQTGSSIEQAAQRSRISPALVARLVELGQSETEEPAPIPQASNSGQLSDSLSPMHEANSHFPFRP